MTPKLVSPLVPFDFLIVALAPAKAADLRDREISRSPGSPLDTINFLHKLGFRHRFPDDVA
jgi:hypothetical protein